VLLPCLDLRPALFEDGAPALWTLPRINADGHPEKPKGWDKGEERGAALMGQAVWEELLSDLEFDHQSRQGRNETHQSLGSAYEAACNQIQINEGGA
jgi:hypothetical protein